MEKQYSALSIVSPGGSKIVQGLKTLEIRSWCPPHVPVKDLLIVENHHYLRQEGDEDSGLAVAVVDIESVHPWREDELEAACGTYWAEGYWAWVITRVRPLDPPVPVVAKRKIYTVEIDHE
ncbi:ASCH domain-containing protein [Acinetobacter chinensis]|uniref:ASCH domain-containing protein n=1 Tax=Acinetobacter chinensis TaxID=2004650 RepID=A0A3B7LZG1_9GAMM|nr:ASCH domain-containing protein [Acinetobacter chinensis]AXY55703.1 ASCH domain-containing protein [Acinetobacter chinensis]